MTRVRTSSPRHPWGKPHGSFMFCQNMWTHNFPLYLIFRDLWLRIEKVQFICINIKWRTSLSQRPFPVVNSTSNPCDLHWFYSSRVFKADEWNYNYADQNQDCSGIIILGRTSSEQKTCRYIFDQRAQGTLLLILTDWIPYPTWDLIGNALYSFLW